jgi:hypothetical protein
MSHTDVKSLLIGYVNRNSNVYNLEWDPRLSEKLLLDPFGKSYEEKKRIAHYFLLVASITETELIGRTENSRALMIHIHKTLGDEIYSQDEACNLRHVVRGSTYYEDLGQSKEIIAETLASINLYVNQIAKGDLISYARKFTKPKEMVKDIARNVDRMDGRFVEKPWMYLRWTTRSHPDLRIFENFSPRDLYMPMTSYIRDIGCCLRLCPEHDDEWWNDLDNTERGREDMTRFARQLFPEDPAKVDYPFYLLGRWIRGKKLCLRLLEEYLGFFEELYQTTGTVPITYDIVSRETSKFEENVKAELVKTKILFYYESHRFHLPNGITYLPDFVLPNCRIKGKTVLLEPHGIWSIPQRRKISIGNRTITIQAYGRENNSHEYQFAKKLQLFRETFGRDYHLILLVPARVKERVKLWYPESHDEIIEGTDIPELLYKLKQSESKK